MPNITKQDDISVLPLSVRSRNCLRNANILTIGAMMEYPEDQFINIRNMGVRSVNEILSYVRMLKNGSGEYMLVESNGCAAPSVPVVHELVSNDGHVSVLLDEVGSIIQDIPVEELRLSVRAKNSLTRNGYRFASQLIGITYEELMNLKSMGAKSAEEVIAYAENISVICDPNDSIAIWRSLAHEMYAVYGKTENYWVREVLTVKAQFPEATGSVMIRHLYDRPFVRDSLRDTILRFIEDSASGVSRTDLERELPPHLLNTAILGKMLLDFETTSAITISAGIIHRLYPSIVEYTASIENDRIREVIQGRIAGKTLQEIGEQFGITREAVRQYMQRGLSARPCLREDRYIYLFEHYDFSLDDFMLAFGEPSETYFYLDMISQAENKDKQPLDDILTDKAIAPEYRKKAERAIYKNYIAVDSVRVKMRRRNLVKHFIKTQCKELTKFDDFVSRYHQWLDAIGLGDNPSFTIEARTYENILNQCDYVLWNQWRSFRYYNIPERDFEELLSTLDLERFINTEFSTLKLFRDYSLLMKQYDIHDEYELHNLLKKIWLPKTISVKFKKMPTIEVGVANTDDQVLALLLQYAPISADGLSNHYEKEYGVKAGTVRGSYLRHLDPYFYKGIYSVDYAALPAVQFNRMKTVLNRDFYTIQDVKQLYKREFPNSDDSLLNPYTLKTLGFHVYPGYSGYVVSNKFSGATDYFNTILTAADEVDMRNYDSAIRNIATYDAEHRRLRSKYHIVEKSPLQYINIRKLAAQGVTADDLRKYCDDISGLCADGEYFTIASLRKNGFTHELDTLGFEEWFYSSVLLEDRDRFSYQRIGGTRIFLRGNTEANLGDMLVWLMKKYRKLDFCDLKDLLKNHYEIIVPKDKLMTIIQSTVLCYDPIMDTVYVDYDSYFTES